MLKQGTTSLLQKFPATSRSLQKPISEGLDVLPSLMKEGKHATTVSQWLLSKWQTQQSSFHMSFNRGHSKRDEGVSQEDAASATAAGAQEPGLEEAELENRYTDLSQEELRSLLLERDNSLATNSAELATKQDQLIRTLADMENLRQRSARNAENTKKFAVQGFLKSMLDVGDNLERAYEAVPAEALSGKTKDGQPISTDRAVQLLNALINGVKLTEKIFDQGLRENSVEKIKPLGQKFDPNLHEALFELSDPSKEAGTVGAVTKTGYTLQGRVVRPAQVGVVKKQ